MDFRITKLILNAPGSDACRHKLCLGKYIKHTWEHSLVLKLNGTKVAASLLLMSPTLQNRGCVQTFYCEWSLGFGPVLLSCAPESSGRMLVSLSAARSFLAIGWYSWSRSSSRGHSLTRRDFVIWIKHWLACNIKLSPTLLSFCSSLGSSGRR